MIRKDVYQIIHRQILHFLYRLKTPIKSIFKAEEQDYDGFTLVELMVVVGILGILAGIAINFYLGSIEKARIIKAISEIRSLEKEILKYDIDWYELPDTLDDLDRESLKDPWRRPYQYQNLENIKEKDKGKGKKKGKYKGNTDFYLFSLGKDGEPSDDDIIRGDDGEYVGMASKY